MLAGKHVSDALSRY